MVRTRVLTFIGALLSLVMVFSMLTVTPVHAAIKKNVPAEVNKVLSEINKFRKSKGLKPVKVNTTISGMSAAWSAKMADSGKFSHNPNYARDKRVNQNWKRAGEIIAYNGGSPSGLVKQWINSPPHNKIMSTASHNVVGIGLAYNKSGKRIYGTVNFYTYSKLPKNTYTSFPTPKPKYSTKGAIGNYYKKYKKTTGAPTSNQKTLTKPSGAVQYFKNGRVYWSKSTGARFVKGAILTAYKKQNTHRSSIGYPSSGQIKTKTATYQKFQKGRIVWSSKTGAKTVKGAILTRWVKAGGTGSKVGIPTGNQYKSGKNIRQNFTKGYMTYNKKSGTKIYYKKK